jgi:hypothetical protein
MREAEMVCSEAGAIRLTAIVLSHGVPGLRHSPSGLS